MNAAKNQLLSVGAIPQTGSSNGSLWLVDGKLVSSLPQGKTGNQLNGSEKIYLTNDGKVTLDASSGIEVKADQAVTIQNEIEACQKKYQDLIDAHKNTGNKDPQTKAAKVKFMKDNVFRRTLNAQPPIILESSNLRNRIPGAIIQKHLGAGATTSTNNQGQSDGDNISTPSPTSTTTSTSVTNPTAGPSSPSTAALTKQQMLDAMMNQFNNSGGDINKAINNINNTKYTAKSYKTFGGKVLEIRFGVLNFKTSYKMRKLMKRIDKLASEAQNEPIKAYHRLISMRSFTDGGKAEASIRRGVRGRLHKGGLIEKPLTRAEYMTLRQNFFDNTLKLLDINMEGNLETIQAVLGLVDSIVINYNQTMQEQFALANRELQVNGTSPQASQSTESTNQTQAQQPSA